MLREAMDTGAADRIGLAPALADENNLRRLAEVYDPQDRGLRDMWEITVTGGRRVGEVPHVHWDCLGHDGGLPAFWTTRPRSATTTPRFVSPSGCTTLSPGGNARPSTASSLSMVTAPSAANAPAWRGSRPATATTTAPSLLPTSGPRPVPRLDYGS